MQTLVSVGPYQFATRQDGGRFGQRARSGPTGISSPAKMTWRRALPERTASDSAALARSSADGTEYQTVTPAETMKRQREDTRPNVEAGTSASRAAAIAAPKKSNTLRSNDGDACWDTTSVSRSPTASTAHGTKASALALRVGHALRLTGGARRVQDVRQRRGRHLNGRAQLVELLELSQARAHRLAFGGPRTDRTSRGRASAARERCPSGRREPEPRRRTRSPACAASRRSRRPARHRRR